MTSNTEVGQPAFPEILTRAAARRGGWATYWAVLGCVVLVLLAASRLLVGEDDHGGAVPATPTPFVMAVVPAVAEPGQLIELTLPTGDLRSGYFTLSRAGQILYYLGVGSPVAKPTWFKAVDVERLNLAQPKITGVGPHQLVVPAIATAGTYQLCSGNTCASLTVSR
ncbi:hypothetical protein [Kribbella sancticallisti]